MIEIVTPAWSIPQSVPPRLVSVRAAARITGSVNADSLLIITIAPEELVPGRDEREQRDGHDAPASSDGRKTRTRIWNGPPPSMTAASSSSRGTASKLLRMMYRLNGSWIVVWTIARPEQRVGQLEAGEHQEHRRQQRLVRDDQGQQQEDEQELLARDREARERVAGRDRERERERDRQQRRPEAVDEIDRQPGLVVPQPLVAVEAELVREVGRRDRRRLGRRLERREDRQHDRRQHHRADGDAEGGGQVPVPTRPRTAATRRGAPGVGPPSLPGHVGAHAWLRRVRIIWMTVNARMISARISDRAAP